MARDHAYIEVWNETWQQLAGPREAYDRTKRDWQTVPSTNWQMAASNLWGDVGLKTELIFDGDSLSAQVRVRSPLIYPTEVDIEIEVSTVSGTRDWAAEMLNLMPWYERESEVTKNCCKMGGAVLSKVESYLLIVKDSLNLATTITTLPNIERELGIQAGNLSLSERRDNIRRIRYMMNENVAWSPNEVYYLPYIGKWSATNAAVQGTTIHDAANCNDPIVQAKVAEWANGYGLEVIK